MAFSYTRSFDATSGNRRYGTWNAASVTGGDIDPGFGSTERYIIMLQQHGASANKAAVVNETISNGGITGAATIVCDSGATGSWEAIAVN